MPEGPTGAMARMWTSTPLFGLVESCWKYQVGWWYLRLMWHIGIYDARRARRRHGRYEFFYTMIIIDFYLSLKSLTVWITRAKLPKKQENLIFLGRLERYPKPTDNQLRIFFPSPLGLRVFFWWFRTCIRSPQNKNFSLNNFFPDGYDTGLSRPY